MAMIGKANRCGRGGEFICPRTKTNPPHPPRRYYRKMSPRYSKRRRYHRMARAI